MALQERAWLCSPVSSVTLACFQRKAIIIAWRFAILGDFEVDELEGQEGFQCVVTGETFGAISTRFDPHVLNSCDAHHWTKALGTRQGWFSVTFTIYETHAKILCPCQVADGQGGTMLTYEAQSCTVCLSAWTKHFRLSFLVACFNLQPRSNDCAIWQDPELTKNATVVPSLLRGKLFLLLCCWLQRRNGAV